MKRDGRGQALVEFALVFPLFVMLLFSIIVLGLYVFYNQQLETAAREAARYASIHSSTAQCPTVSRIDPIGPNRPDSYFRCDAPEDGWPRLTGAARSAIGGMAPSAVTVAACWSGLVDANSPPNADVLPDEPTGTFTDCTINNIDPKTDPGGLSCPAPATLGSASGVSGGKADGDDKASDIAATTSTNSHFPTTVTVYACVVWTPPMAGFVIIPSTITIRAVATEAMERQQ